MSSTTGPEGPFTGLTVVEFGQFIAVPFAAQMLATGGARVIKVEPKGGDGYRRLGDPTPGADRQFYNKNRAKESVAIDLSHPESSAVVRALIAFADVVLVNMSPSTVARHGLRYEDVSAINPRAVYGIVSAYGSRGRFAKQPGMDIVVQARTGLLNALDSERDGIPHASEVPMVDHTTALLLLNGVSAALLARARTGRGQRVEVSLTAGALVLQNKELVHVFDVDAWRTQFVDETLPAMRRTGASVEEIAQLRNDMRPDVGGASALFHAHFRVFRAKDGFVTLGAGSQAARKRLFEVLGLEEALSADPPALTARIAEILATETPRHWEDVLGSVGVPVSEVRHVEEMLFDDDLLDLGLIADYHDPVLGHWRGAGSPIELSDTPWQSAAPAPRFAEDTRQVLSDVGFGPDRVAELIAAGAVVEGPILAAAVAGPADDIQAE